MKDRPRMRRAGLALALLLTACSAAPVAVPAAQVPVVAEPQPVPTAAAAVAAEPTALPVSPSDAEPTPASEIAQESMAPATPEPTREGHEGQAAGAGQSGAPS